MKPVAQFCILTAAALVSSCGESSHKEKHDSAPTYMLYSLNGEPLNGGPLGRPTCQQAFTDWVNRLSSGSAGITKTVFLSDARVQFTRMDIDHNGYIVSEELDRFREPYRQQQDSAKSHSEENAGSDANAHGKHSHKGKSKESSGENTSDRSLSLADPVMSADTNLDFKVTLEEFLKQAEENFAKLDANHDGVIDKTEATISCEQKP
jgi:Ca2+-binding EF-hand superfamily protein